MTKETHITKKLMELVSIDEGLIEFFQLALLGLLTHKVIHDTNNQLTGILGYLTLAQKTALIPGQIESLFKRTLNCCETSQSINHSFLDFFDRNGKPFTSYAVLKKTISFCKKMFAPNCTIRLSERLSTPTIAAPESEVKLILLNSMLAARNEIAEHGVIQVEITMDEETIPSSIVLDIKTHPHHLKKHKEFQEGYSEILSSSILIKEMGHFLAQEYARRNGGEVVYNNRSKNPGSHRIRLPLRNGQSEALAREVKQQESIQSINKLRCLVLLEDQPVISEYIESLFPQDGQSVIHYNSDNELIRSIPAMNFDEIDVFLLDVCIPSTNGIEVGVKIRERDPDSKIVFSSALQTEQSICKTFPLDGKTKFLQKPFKKEELFEILESVLSEKE